MKTRWHYNRNGEKHGPISDSDLRTLAADGSLKPDDLIWKEGMAEWRKAGAVKGLFAQGKQTPPPIPTAPSLDTATNPDASPLEKKPSVSFGESAKLAGQLTARKAELTKIQQASLPGPYAIIGKHAFEVGIEKQNHESLYQEIERLNSTTATFREISANDSGSYGTCWSSIPKALVLGF